MQIRKIKIIGTGKYLPKNKVTAADISARHGYDRNWIEHNAGVFVRHFVEDETASQMGALAAQRALADAGLTYTDIDCIVCTSGTMEQAIPSTASLIQKALGQAESGTPAFDINSTCLSFVTGLDHISYLVAAGRYKYVLLIATEIASVGINWEHKESSAIFGDGAAAVVIGPSADDEQAKIVCSRMETYSSGAHLTEIRGGGTKIHPREYTTETRQHFLFDMNGKAVFKLSAQLLPGFVDCMMQEARLSMDDIKLVIPHQASLMAMKLICKKLSITEKQMMIIAPDHGNTIAASIPMALHEAIRQGRMNRGDRILLLGTSAGFSLGGIVLEY